MQPHAGTRFVVSCNQETEQFGFFRQEEELLDLCKSQKIVVCQGPRAAQEIYRCPHHQAA